MNDHPYVILDAPWVDAAQARGRAGLPGLRAAPGAAGTLPGAPGSATTRARPGRSDHAGERPPARSADAGPGLAVAAGRWTRIQRSWDGAPQARAGAAGDRRVGLDGRPGGSAGRHQARAREAGGDRSAFAVRARRRRRVCGCSRATCRPTMAPLGRRCRRSRRSVRSCDELQQAVGESRCRRRHGVVPNGRRRGGMRWPRVRPDADQRHRGADGRPERLPGLLIRGPILQGLLRISRPDAPCGCSASRTARTRTWACSAQISDASLGATYDASDPSTIDRGLRGRDLQLLMEVGRMGRIDPIAGSHRRRRVQWPRSCSGCR